MQLHLKLSVTLYGLRHMEASETPVFEDISKTFPMLVLSLALFANAGFEVPLVDFKGSDPKLTHTWKPNNDPVMGGQSYSTVVVQNEVLNFTGKCAIVPSLQAPGFITAVNSDKAPWVDVSGCEGLKITSKSTIPYSGFRISFGNAHPIGGKFFAFGYKADFHPPLNTMGSVYVPFNNFTDVCRCHPTAARIAFGQPPLTGASLRSSRAVLGRLDRQSHPHVPGESQLLSRCEDACQHEDHVHLGGGRRGRREPSGVGDRRLRMHPVVTHVDICRSSIGH